MFVCVYLCERVCARVFVCVFLCERVCAGVYFFLYTRICNRLTCFGIDSGGGGCGGREKLLLVILANISCVCLSGSMLIKFMDYLSLSLPRKPRGTGTGSEKSAL